MAAKIDDERGKAARERTFLPKRELAERTALDRNKIDRKENGGTEVYPRTISKLGEALSVNPASLTLKD